MGSRQLYGGVIFVLSGWLFAGAASAISPAAQRATDPPADKAIVLDGHVVHDVGNIRHHVGNWGLIGSAPGLSTTFSDAPSAMWPPASGNEYLWAAGLWVGARVGGVPRVTTAGYSSEFRPTPAPADTIHPTATGAPGGNRYPWPDPDDDGDGVEDEEALNGLDDDGDGLIDEDYAAFGDQQFVCAYNDLEPEIVSVHPDHVPLGLRIVQQSIQWADPLLADFIGYEFTITNVGTQMLDDVFLGMFSDHDIGPRGVEVAANDYAGFVDTIGMAADGTSVPVKLAYMYDGSGEYHINGYVGWVLCGHALDAAGVVAPPALVVNSFQRFSGNASFANGGDPTNDAERYLLLSAQQRDPDVLPGRYADYRVLMASGPFATLAPGQSLRYQVALVLGAGLADLIDNAAEAVATCRGVAYDRDGDPANGAEFAVPWLSALEAPVSAHAGRLEAAVAAGGVELVVETNGGDESGLRIVRRAGRDVPGRQWSRALLEALGIEGGRQRFRLLDADQAGWPRDYALELAGASEAIVLDEVHLAGPGATLLSLSAGPNPFNPLVKVRYAVPRSGQVKLQAFDVRGRLVRTLLDRAVAAGAGELEWRGDDDAGRSLASGVYELRLTTAGGAASERVTLVR
jgi:hypothetical protein